jgi:hypothetical protein
MDDDEFLAYHANPNEENDAFQSSKKGKKKAKEPPKRTWWEWMKQTIPHVTSGAHEAVGAAKTAKEAYDIYNKIKGQGLYGGAPPPQALNFDLPTTTSAPAPSKRRKPSFDIKAAPTYAKGKFNRQRQDQRAANFAELPGVPDEEDGAPSKSKGPLKRRENESDLDYVKRRHAELVQNRQHVTAGAHDAIKGVHWGLSEIHKNQDDIKTAWKDGKEVVTAIWNGIKWLYPRQLIHGWDKPAIEAAKGQASAPAPTGPSTTPTPRRPPTLTGPSEMGSGGVAGGRGGVAGSGYKRGRHGGMIGPPSTWPDRDGYKSMRLGATFGKVSASHGAGFGVSDSDEEEYEDFERLGIEMH